MSHHFFFEGITGSAPSLVDPRLGEYVVGGQFSLVLGTPGVTTNYLFDATAQSLAASSDFVILTIVNAVTTTVLPTAEYINVVIDAQGDSGSGSFLSSGVGTTNGKLANWCLNSKQQVFQRDSTAVSHDTQELVVPSSIFGTSDSSRTGVYIWNAQTETTRRPILNFTFCSWVASGNVTGNRLGEYTVDGAFAFTPSTTEGNYLFDASAKTAVGNSDFTIVTQAVLTNGSTGIRTVRFDCQGDSGSGSLASSGVGTTTSKSVIHSCDQQTSIIVPSSLFGTSDSTRTGRIIVSSSNNRIRFIFCSWV